MARSRHPAPHRRWLSALSSALVALWAVFAVAAVQARPAFAWSGSPRGSETAASASEHATISIGEARHGEVHALRRSSKSADRSRERRSRDGAAPSLRFTTPAPASFGVTPLVATLRPEIWAAWYPPGRARAHLMVFLN